MTDLKTMGGGAHALTDCPHTPGVITPEQRDNLAVIAEKFPHWFVYHHLCGDEGREGKAPLNPRKVKREGITPGPVTGVSASNPKGSAVAFAVALALLPTVDGIGCALKTADPDAVILDFDHVRGLDGQLNSIGAWVLHHFKGAYIEISPSGTGLRVAVVGRSGLPPGKIKFFPRDIDGNPIKGPDGADTGIEVFRAGHGSYTRMTGALIRGVGVAQWVACESGMHWVLDLYEHSKKCKTYPDKVGNSSPGRAGSVGLTVDQVLDRLEHYRGNEGKTPAEVQGALKLSASRKPSGGLAQALALMASGVDKISEQELHVMCEAFRRGIGTIEDAGELLTMLATRDKVKRKNYQKSTAETAARAVLEEIETRGFNRNGFRAQVRGNLPDKEIDKAPPPMPDGVAEALADSGEVIVRTNSGKVIPTPGNVKTILISDPRTRGLLAFNESTQEVERAGSWRVFDQHAADKPGNLQDIDISFTAAWLMSAWGVNMKKGDVCEGIEMAARAKSYDPLRDALIGLVWDAKPRVHSWLKDFAMVDDSGCIEYVSQAGACFLVGAVARALDPGCEFHTALTVEGSGGGGKSNMFKILADAVGPDLFTDGVHDVSNSVHMVEATEGKYIVEIAELSGFRKASDQEALKKAMSARRDKVRKPYMRKPVEIPRRFVFVATTNQDQYIADPTGAASRRFMPVRTLATEPNPIDRAALAEVAPQLWAEAVHLYVNNLQATYIDPNSAAGKQWVIERGERQEDLPFDEAVDLLMMAIERGSVPAYRIGPNGAGGITANDAAKAMRLDTEKILDGKYTDRVAKTLRAKGFIRQPKSNNFRRWLMPPALLLLAGRMRSEMGKGSCL